MTETSNEIKTVSYMDRLIQEFTNSKKTSFKTNEIVKMIEDFRTEQNNIKKEKIDILPIGKYKYKKIVDVAKFDRPYLQWMSKQSWMENYPNTKSEISKYVN